MADVTLRQVALEFGLTDKEFLKAAGLAPWHAEGGRCLADKEYQVPERCAQFYRDWLLRLGKRPQPQAQEMQERSKAA